MKNKKAKFSFQRFFAIVKKEAQQLRRDQFSMRIPILMPIGMMLLFGYVVNTEVENIQTAVFDQCRTQESREYIESFHHTGYFVIEYDVNSQEEMDSLFVSGRIKAGIIIPMDFSKNLKTEKTTGVELYIDGSDSTVARTALSSGMLISQNYAIHKMQKSFSSKGITNLDAQVIDLRTKVWYNPNMEMKKFTIPGLVGLIVQNITIMLTAFAMVREKERGTIEQLIVTPVKPNELILGKLVPYVVIGYLGFLFALAICHFWFRVAIVGNVSTLLLLGALFVICCLSIGMLISTFAKNQLQAMIMTVVILLPSILMSGFMFPIEAMPKIIQPFTYAIPLTYFLKIARGIILKGAGMNVLWQESLALLGFLTVVLSIAIKRFKKSLD